VHGVGGGAGRRVLVHLGDEEGRGRVLGGGLWQSHGKAGVGVGAFAVAWRLGCGRSGRVGRERVLVAEMGHCYLKQKFNYQICYRLF